MRAYFSTLRGEACFGGLGAYLLFCIVSLFLASLNSGSNGNCYYVGNAREAVLIDAGLSCKETVRRMRKLGLSMERVKAVFITHEHIDHIKGAESIARQYRLPIYITAATFDHSRLRIDEAQVRAFKAYEPILIGGLSVIPFPKQHDAIDPHSFLVKGFGITVGVFTDIGAPCQHVVDNFRQCHAAFLEANYDEQMLEHGKYPAHLKKRISGDQGHLSNRQAVELFLAHGPAFMSHLFLSHLSQENNKPELAEKVFARHAGKTSITVASRHEASQLFEIQSTQVKEKVAQKPAVQQKAIQISLFG
jgi:phosphoribosyl 1,2-cyclic phosphodiesterase